MEKRTRKQTWIDVRAETKQINRSKRAGFTKHWTSKYVDRGVMQMLKIVVPRSRTKIRWIVSRKAEGKIVKQLHTFGNGLR